MATSRKLAASLAVMIMAFASRALAEGALLCSSRITRSNLVECALRASLLVKGERQELEATEARKISVSPLLPSNPVLALSGGKTSSSSFANYTWSATLSQELEVAGQRGLRRDAADASIAAQSNRVALSRRDTAALAWVAFFEAVAAREERDLADRLTSATQAVAIAARARAEKGLIAAVDADVADATTVRVLQTKLAAERRVDQGRATLASILGLAPVPGSLLVEGELVPIPEVAGYSGAVIAERPEMLVVEAQRRALELRADALRRTRISNPTVSIFAQNDEFNDRVVGLGISFPVPLPGNVGRTYVGEIAEAEALARRTVTDRERIERAIRLEVTTATQAFLSRGKEVEAFTPERLTRADATLISLGQEVEAGRLAVRDAVVAQQALIELLRANVEARRAWCLASVDLARAVGLPLEGRAP